MFYIVWYVLKIQIDQHRLTNTDWPTQIDQHRTTNIYIDQHWLTNTDRLTLIPTDRLIESPNNKSTSSLTDIWSHSPSKQQVQECIEPSPTDNWLNKGKIQ